MQSVPITTKLWVRIPLMAGCTWYSIMLVFLSVTCCRLVVSSTNNTHRHDMAEILLKVVLNTLTLTLLIKVTKYHEINIIQTSGQKWLCQVNCSICYIWINVREYRRGYKKWTIQRNWQHSLHKTKKNKAKTHHYVSTNTT
jgi:hypothetical protein